MEKGASKYEDRINAIKQIAPHKRVIVRVQPYIPDVLIDVLKEVRVWAEIGVYGIVIEGMKYASRVKGVELVSVGADMCYRVGLLKEHYDKIKASCHKNGLRFFCGENRLRAMGDSLCCCGIEGMGWKENKANLNHIIYDPQGVAYSNGQKTHPITRLCQKTTAQYYAKSHSYEDAMKLIAKSTMVNNIKPIK